MSSVVYKIGWKVWGLNINLNTQFSPFTPMVKGLIFWALITKGVHHPQLIIADTFIDQCNAYMWFNHNFSLVGQVWYVLQTIVEYNNWHLICNVM